MAPLWKAHRELMSDDEIGDVSASRLPPVTSNVSTQTEPERASNADLKEIISGVCILNDLAKNLDSRLAGGFDSELREEGSSSERKNRQQQLPFAFALKRQIEEVNTKLDKLLNAYDAETKLAAKKTAAATANMNTKMTTTMRDIAKEQTAVVARDLSISNERHKADKEDSEQRLKRVEAENESLNIKLKAVEAKLKKPKEQSVSLQAFKEQNAELQLAKEQAWQAASQTERLSFQLAAMEIKLQDMDERRPASDAKSELDTHLQLVDGRVGGVESVLTLVGERHRRLAKAHQLTDCKLMKLEQSVENLRSDVDRVDCWIDKEIKWGEAEHAWSVSEFNRVNDDLRRVERKAETMSPHLAQPPRGYGRPRYRDPVDADGW